MKYNAQAAAAFYDEYGEREWTRFEDGRTPAASVATHAHYLRRFVASGDRVLDIGCGPGRFTIELARIGATVVAADISTAQLALNERFVTEAGAGGAVEERLVVDAVDLSRFADGTFDAVVCFGGALSYVIEQAPRAAAELARVTRPGGHVLVSVMALVGATINAIDGVLAIADEYGNAAVSGVTASGLLPHEYGGHLPMKMYRWRELQELLSPHGELVAASATGLFKDSAEHEDLLAEVELELGAEPGALDAGRHILAVVRV
ncbi:MAG: class I SAM-dependent methyltransferase [Gaiellaceae bacterium]